MGRDETKYGNYLFSNEKCSNWICKALSQELALTNVTVNAIAPGFVSGRMAKAFSDEDKAVILSELPQQRMIAHKK